MLPRPPAPPPTEPPPGGWHPSDGARLAEATGRRSAAARGFAALSRLFTRGRTYEVFRVLGLAPRLFRPFIAFNARLMPFGRLDRLDTERVILRVAWRTRSEYEWRQHCAIAQDLGMAVDEIGAIASARPATALLRAVDDLLDEHAVGEEAWRELRPRLTDAQMVELCLLTGNYAMLAGALNSFGAPIEPPLRGGAGASK